MADPDPTDIVGPGTLGSCFISEETVAFGTKATELQAFPVEGTIKWSAEQAELELGSLRTAAWDAQDPVLGLKSGSVQLGHYLQPSAQVLNQALSPTPIVDTPLAILLRCALGGESKNFGTVEASGPAADGCVVAATEGARFLAGQIALIEDPDASIGLVPARILSRSTDTLTWWPSLSGAIASGGAILNTWTWYPTVSNSRSASLALAAGQDAAYQWLFEGCAVNFELQLQRGELAQGNFTLKAAKWTGPTAQSYSIASAADSMGSPIPCRTMACYLQPIATTTRVAYEVDSVNVKVLAQPDHLQTLGGTEGMRGVARLAGLAGHFAEIEVVARAHRAVDATWWTSRTGLSFMLWASSGAVSSEKMIIIDAGLVKVVGKPVFEDSLTDEMKVKFTLRCYIDTSVTGTTELADAPLRIAVGG